MQTPEDLLEIESQLLSLRVNVPPVVVFHAPMPPWEKTWSRYYVAGLCLLLGLVIGGVTVDQLRPAPTPVEIVRVVEVPVEIPMQVAAHRHPRESGEPDNRPFSLGFRLRGNDEKSQNLDAMFEEYNRRAQLFAKLKWVATVSRPSTGSISDPMSAFQLRQTFDL